MAREVDEKKRRKALRKLRKAALLAEQGLGPPLSDWEKQFLEEIEARIETYGSAFHDLEKGGADEPLSALQTVKLREIDKKARGKTKSGFGKNRSGFKAKQARRPNVRQLDEVDQSDAMEPLAEPSPQRGPVLVKASELSDHRPPSQPPKPDRRKRPVLKVIRGGADGD